MDWPINHPVIRAKLEMVEIRSVWFLGAGGKEPLTIKSLRKTPFKRELPGDIMGICNNLNPKWQATADIKVTIPSFWETSRSPGKGCAA